MPRIIVTGGSGKAGRHVIPYLISKGHSVLNLDLIPFPDPSVDVYTLKVDLTNSGQVFNALTSRFSLTEFGVARPGPPMTPDAVIHLAAYARNMLVPDNETFASNTQSTYNIIEASSKLGIKKVIIASSETTYGVCFAQGDKDWHQFPLEEDYPVDPADSYALSKLVGELTAKTFNIRHPDMDIYALRIGNVIEPHEYAQDFPGYLKHPEGRKRNAWSYIDARDLGQICDLCVEKDGLGFQVSLAGPFWSDENSRTDHAFRCDSGLQRYQRYHHHSRTHGRGPCQVLPERQDHPRDGRMGRSPIEQEDQGDVGFQGRSQLERLR
jgi:nucleoside-diphosphate-sugar epimerase